MMQMTYLNEAINVANAVHRGQIDKAGAPYILHPMRVMLSVTTLRERIVAVLHDVIEDSAWTSMNLCTTYNYGDDIKHALDAVTRKEDETYNAFIFRVGQNDIARIVKMADLKDNMDMSRFLSPTLKDFKRYHKYKKAYSYLKHLRD